MEKENESKRSSGEDAVPEIPYKNESFDDDSKVPYFTLRLFMMTVLVSMGGLCFGYDTGQISGFLEMVACFHHVRKIHMLTTPGCFPLPIR